MTTNNIKKLLFTNKFAEEKVYIEVKNGLEAKKASEIVTILFKINNHIPLLNWGNNNLSKDSYIGSLYLTKNAVGEFYCSFVTDSRETLEQNGHLVLSVEQLEMIKDEMLADF